MPENEYWFQRWVTSDDAAALGIVFEAILACHAIQFEACFNCTVRKSLSWSGASGTAWQEDLVCIKCKSLYYEAKIKEAAISNGMRTIVRGSSFSMCRGLFAQESNFLSLSIPSYLFDRAWTLWWRNGYRSTLLFPSYSVSILAMTRDCVSMLVSTSTWSTTSRMNRPLTPKHS